MSHLRARALGGLERLAWGEAQRNPRGTMVETSRLEFRLETCGLEGLKKLARGEAQRNPGKRYRSRVGVPKGRQKMPLQPNLRHFW